MCDSAKCQNCPASNFLKFQKELDEVLDSRFRDIMGPNVWDALPAAVRHRFGNRLGAAESTVYQGAVTEMRMTFAGRILAHAARIVGGPLPYDISSVGQPAVVSVTEDRAGRGQFWIRQYGREAGFPQIIHSSKRFAGPTGIEEYIGLGIGIALRLSPVPDGLRFDSDHYFIKLGGWRLRLPKWLQAGKLCVVHQDLGQGAFRFSLTLTDPFGGEMIHQDAIFHDKED